MTLRELLLRLRGAFGKPRFDRELDREMAAHLEFAIEDNLERGMSAAQASRQARVSFGGPQQAREKHRDSRGLPFLDSLFRDVRYAVRTLGRDRAFALIAILILALGIGANITVFSVVNAILLHPLPFSEPRQLAWFDSNRGAGGLSAVTYTVAVYDEIRRHNQSFQKVTAYNPFFGNGEYSMTGRGEPMAVVGVMVAPEFFQTLGLPPILGRAFFPEESLKGAKPAVILSNAFWRRHFASDPSIVGQGVVLDKRQYSVVGVLPSSFDFGSVFSPGLNVDLYVPADMEEISHWGNTLSIIGRLKPGVSVHAAQAEADLLLPQLRAAHSEWYGGYETTISGLRDHVSGKLRNSLVLLWSAVALILLIVCVNLANLLLARSAARSKEFAVRAALGAGRSHVVRQLLAESLILSTASAALGLLLSFAATSYLARQSAVALPLLGSVAVDGAALSWTLLVALVAAVLFGLVPGFLVSGGNLQEGLASSGRGSTDGKHHAGLRSLLVISEIALACVLLVSAGLLLRSFLRVLNVDLGFQPTQAAALKISYDDGGDEKKRALILEEILRRVQQIPGVEAAGVSDMLPLGRNRSWGFQAADRAYGKDDITGAYVRIVTPGYLRAMGIRLLEGRDFSWTEDRSDTQTSVIVNQAAANLHWPGQSAVGKQAAGFGTKPGRVIGVIADVRQGSLEDISTPEMFLSAAQAGPEGAELVVRTKLPPERLGPTLTRMLREIHPEQPVADFRPLQHIVDHSVSPRRFFVTLVASFAGLGLILAALGIYGVISYMVTRQKQEIGIRMALGATRGTVQAGVMTRALRMAFIGIAAGAVASFLVGRWIASLLYRTEPTDPVTFLAMLIIFAGVAALAGYIPALRASRVNPLTALRAE
jgi:predicted permease